MKNKFVKGLAKAAFAAVAAVGVLTSFGGVPSANATLDYSGGDSGTFCLQFVPQSGWGYPAWVENGQTVYDPNGMCNI